MHAQCAAAASQRSLDRFRDARPVRGREPHPVLDDFEVLALPAVDARVTLAGEQLLHFLRREVLGHRDRESDDDPGRRVLGAKAREEVFEDAPGGIPADRVPAAAAAEACSAGEEQLEVIVQLRHRAHGGARRGAPG